MVNLISFISAFASYLLVFIVFVVAIIVAVFIGTNLRKMKNKSQAKKEMVSTDEK